MANYTIRLDLKKIPGAFTANITGRTATKPCLCIPLDDSGLYNGAKGCYLTLTAIAMAEPKFDDTHCIKIRLDKDEYDRMIEDERRAQPIIGGMHELQRKTPVEAEATAQIFPEAGQDDGLPF